MALQSSGAISLGDIQTEYGGSNPISISEYYKNGSYVPETASLIVTGTASNLTYTESQSAKQNWGGNYSNFWRYYENGSGPLPTINSTYFFDQQWYPDQAWVNAGGTWVDVQFNLDQAGTYNIKDISYITWDFSHYTDVYINGVYTTRIPCKDSYEFTITAAATIRLYCYMNTTNNYQSHRVIVVGNTGTNNRELITQETVNTNVPTSGVIQLDDFYGGKKTI